MSKQRFRLVCSMDGTWAVQKLDEASLVVKWYPCYLCKERNEAGYHEAKKWMEENGI